LPLPGRVSKAPPQAAQFAELLSYFQSTLNVPQERIGLTQQLIGPPQPDVGGGSGCQRPSDDSATGELEILYGSLEPSTELEDSCGIVTLPLFLSLQLVAVSKHVREMNHPIL
jgi:hypothetical protein